MSTQPFSPTNWAAAQAANYLNPGKDDGYLTQAGKMTGSFIANLPITVLGALETASVGLITSIAYAVLYAFTTDFVKDNIVDMQNWSNESLASLRNRTLVAYNATLDAAWGIVSSYPAIKVAPKKEEPKKEEPKATGWKASALNAAASAANMFKTGASYFNPFSYFGSKDLNDSNNTNEIVNDRL